MVKQAQWKQYLYPTVNHFAGIAYAAARQDAAPYTMRAVARSYKRGCNQYFSRFQ
jgi:hypothetical protein